MLTIYGSDLSSPANKVRFVANALGLHYEYKRVNLREGEQRKPEFLKLNPAGKVPVIDDDGFILFESNAIIRYLARKQKSTLYPSDVQARAVVEQWLDFGSLHVGAALVKVTYNRLFAARLNITPDEKSIQEGLEFLNRFLPVVENQLSNNAYLAGNSLTLADFNLLAILDPTELSGVDLTPYSHIVKWRQNLRQQDFYTQCYKEYGESLQKPAGV